MAQFQLHDLKVACMQLRAARGRKMEAGRDDRMLWAKIRLGRVHLGVYWDSYSHDLSVDLRHEDWPNEVVGLGDLEMDLTGQTPHAIGATDAASLRAAMRSVDAVLSAPASRPILAGDREAWARLLQRVAKRCEDYTFRYTAEIAPDAARASLQRGIVEQRAVAVRLGDGVLRQFVPEKLRLDQRGVEVCIGMFVATDGARRAGVIPVGALKAIAMSEAPPQSGDSQKPPGSADEQGPSSP